MDSVIGGNFSEIVHNTPRTLWVLAHNAPRTLCKFAIIALSLLVPVCIALVCACITLTIGMLCTAPLAVSYFTIRAARDRPKFAFETSNNWTKNEDSPFTHVLLAFVKGLFISMRSCGLKRRAREVAREVRLEPVLLCNVFLWAFVSLFPFLIAVRHMVDVMAALKMPIRVLKPQPPSHPDY